MIFPVWRTRPRAIYGGEVARHRRISSVKHGPRSSHVRYSVILVQIFPFCFYDTVSKVVPEVMDETRAVFERDY